MPMILNKPKRISPDRLRSSSDCSRVMIPEPDDGRNQAITRFDSETGEDPGLMSEMAMLRQLTIVATAVLFAQHLFRGNPNRS